MVFPYLVLGTLNVGDTKIVECSTSSYKVAILVAQLKEISCVAILLDIMHFVVTILEIGEC